MKLVQLTSKSMKSESLNISYELAKKIDWEGKYYRKDIGRDLINKNK